MTKYFTKEQVMNAMEEQNLMLDDIWGVEQRLDELPVADVVEVVRCKDCEHMRTISGEGWGIDTELYYCGENEILVSPVGYCSEGKRKKCKDCANRKGCDIWRVHMNNDDYCSRFTR